MRKRLSKEARERIKEKALHDYKRGDPLREIAIRYNTSITAVSLWAKEARLKRRQQGCRHKEWPDQEDIEIVQAVRAVCDGSPTLDEIGERFGNKTRAGIHRIYTKWKDWKPKLPFKPGDKIRYDGHDFLVVKPGVFKGKVKDLASGELVDIHWKHKLDNGEVWMAVKI